VDGPNASKIHPPTARNHPPGDAPHVHTAARRRTCEYGTCPHNPQHLLLLLFLKSLEEKTKQKQRWGRTGDSSARSLFYRHVDGEAEVTPHLTTA
jgi:hypothetical protein